MTENIQNKIYRGIFSGVLVGALSLGTGYLIGQYKNTKIENQTQEYKVSQKENYSLDLENKPQVLEDKLLDERKNPEKNLEEISKTDSIKKEEKKDEKKLSKLLARGLAEIYVKSLSRAYEEEVKKSFIEADIPGKLIKGDNDELKNSKSEYKNQEERINPNEAPKAPKEYK